MDLKNVLNDINGCSGVGRSGAGLRGVEGSTNLSSSGDEGVPEKVLELIHGMWAIFGLGLLEEVSGVLIFCREYNFNKPLIMTK